MKNPLQKPVNLKLAMAAVAACHTCAAVLLLADIKWMGLTFCTLGALTLMLSGKMALLATTALTVVYGVLKWVLVGHFSPTFLVLGAGIIVTRALLNVGYKKLENVEKELSRERQRRDATTLISALGQTRNLRAYQNDASIFLRLAARHNLSLCLIIWKLENAALLHQKLGDAAYAELLGLISSTMSTSIRGEDMLYLLHEKDDKIEWGTLHIANKPNVDAAIKGRVLKAVSEIPMENGLTLDIQVVSAIAAPEMTPMSLLESAGSHAV